MYKKYVLSKIKIAWDKIKIPKEIHRLILHSADVKTELVRNHKSLKWRLLY